MNAQPRPGSREEYMKLIIQIPCYNEEETLGITLDGFRIGAGSLLFLSAVSLVGGNRSSHDVAPDVDFAVVPLAIPITVGPASIGTLLILGGLFAVVLPGRILAGRRARRPGR